MVMPIMDIQFLVFALCVLYNNFYDKECNYRDFYCLAYKHSTISSMTCFQTAAALKSQSNSLYLSNSSL